MKKWSGIVLFALLMISVLAVCAFAEGDREGTAVLMNIPYDVFYTTEGVADVGLDAVSSATKNKPRTMTLSGGSYHVNADGTDISGVIYPVYVQDMAQLKALGGRQITDSSSVEITTTNRGKTVTNTYSGREALYEAPSYSYYILPAGEAPAFYKTLTANGFTAIKGRDANVEATASFKQDLRHCDIAVAVSGLDLGEDEYVSGVELISEDGTAYGLRHIDGIWRKMELGLHIDSALGKALADKRIAKIRYITQKGKYAFNVDLPMIVHFNALDEVLMLPNGIMTIEAEAFADSAAKAIDIPASESGQSIGSAAFTGIPQPYYVRIPNSVTSIADDAFDDGQIIIFCEKDSAAYTYLSGKSNIIWRNSSVPY